MAAIVLPPKCLSFPRSVANRPPRGGLAWTMIWIVMLCGRATFADRPHTQPGTVSTSDRPQPPMRPSDPADPSFSIRNDIPVTDYPDTGRDQPRRPGYHFTSRRNWINDPNGMVHDGQRYHLFFQHNPLGTDWGNMTWGHAVSKDMVHWDQQPHALLPYAVDGRDGTIFSGTAIQDHMDSLGHRSGSVPTLAAMYTFAAKPRFYQSLAYSTDRGETWTLHDNGRAVVPNQGLHPEERDPKVFWHGPTEQWGMVLWVNFDESTEQGTLRFFRSDDLLDWEKVCDVVRPWAYECPDIFFKQVDGEGETKTVLYDASGDYEIGVYDGKQFCSETGPLKFGEDGHLYAFQTFNNQPKFRTIQMAWMRGGPDADAVDVPFRNQMSFPVELKIVSTKQGPRLSAKPIGEIVSLITAEDRFDVDLMADQTITGGFQSDNQLDIDLEIQPGGVKQIDMTIAGLNLHFIADGNRLQFDGDQGPVTLFENMVADQGVIHCRLLIDRMSVEAFTAGGTRWTARYALPTLGPSLPTFHAAGGSANVAGVVRHLTSAW